MVNNFRQVSNKLKKEGWEVVRVAGSHLERKGAAVQLLFLTILVKLLVLM